MLNIHKKTTSISIEPHKPLEVEWTTEHGYELQPDGSFKPVDEHVVALVMPAHGFFTRSPLTSFHPGTAYNLYKWLHNNIETIKALAGIEDANGQGTS
ncbi:MAG: hypothetical protein AUF65_01460 [Chloroflexi bacterium 13_1_20CM_50_12]|nr:MAG: hypothetical protein AUF65_01460 [Chloroflexi bacterium 13_1_20CM_50_12]